MAAPPPFWHLCQGKAKSVKVDSIWEEHREYTRNMEEWQEKLTRFAGTLALGNREEAGKVSEKRKWPVALGHLNARPPEQLRRPTSQNPKSMNSQAKTFSCPRQ